MPFCRPHCKFRKETSTGSRKCVLKLVLLIPNIFIFIFSKFSVNFWNFFLAIFAFWILIRLISLADLFSTLFFCLQRRPALVSARRARVSHLPERVAPCLAPAARRKRRRMMMRRRKGARRRSTTHTLSPSSRYQNWSSPRPERRRKRYRTCFLSFILRVAF